jgi:hypothetical protein
VRRITRTMLERLAPEDAGKLPHRDDYVWVAEEWRKHARGEPSAFTAP